MFSNSARSFREWVEQKTSFVQFYDYSRMFTDLTVWQKLESDKSLTVKPVNIHI